MSDQNYQLFDYALRNRGVVAKFVQDDTPQNTFLSLNSCESRQENSISSRLGPSMVTTNGVNNVPLADTNVHTLRRLKGLFGNTWRYAGAGNNLYRRTGDANGAYTQINGAFALSGQRFSADVYRPPLSSEPYLFIADKSQMLKDSGIGNVQRNGIAPPTVPATISLLNNSILDIAGFAFGGGAYTTVNVGGFAQGTRLTSAVTVAAAIPATGLNTFTPSSMANIQAGMFIIYDVGGGNQESVQIISVTATTATAFFTKTHPGGAALQDLGYTGTVAANTTATISKSTALNLAAIGGVSSPTTDFINLFVNVSDPGQLQQAQILFDVGDGSFTQSYYLATITAAQIQQLISGTSSPQQTLPAAVFARAGGFAVPTAGRFFRSVLPDDGGDIGVGSGDITPLVPTPLMTGLSQWSLIQVQKSNFIPVGQAGQPGHDWSNINAWRISFQTTITGSITFAVDDFYLFGGSGLSSLGGIAYDYRYTYYNINTGEESNPSQTLISSLGILAMNQPIKVSWTASGDSQVTHVRVYRRGGGLSTGWNLVAKVAIGTTTFTDTLFDSFVVGQPALAIDNDMPVTSTLPVPVNTTLGTVVTAGSIQTVTPGSITNIFANQLMTIDTGTAQELIWVQSVNTGAGTFTAYFQNAHGSTAAISANTQPNTPMNLFAVAFDTAWYAGDPNNPHILYYSKRFNPGAVPPQNTLEVGKPSDPIMGVIDFRGLLYVFTVSKIYSVYSPGGISPQVYPTAEVTYGLVANFGWCVGNGEIKYQSKDGIRKFRGGASELMTLGVDWLETGQTFGPIVPADTTQFSSTLMAYFNREMYVSYVGTDGNRHRITWSDDFSRWRNDDILSNALFVEEDTNKLLTADTNGNIFQDRVNNFDDGGFVAGVQVKNAIPMTLQTPYLNQGKAKNEKIYQELTVKLDTQGETVTVQLLFNEGTTTLTLGTITQNGMAVVNLGPINGGDGQKAYNVSLKITGNVKNVVTVREFALKAIIHTDSRQSLDTYWQDENTPEWKLLKQSWVIYSTSTLNNPITFSVFVDGNLSSPEFTVDLPATLVRQPLRVRFTPIKCRVWRIILTSSADFYWYSESFTEVKRLSMNKGYERKQLQAVV